MKIPIKGELALETGKAVFNIKAVDAMENPSQSVRYEVRTKAVVSPQLMITDC